MSVDCIHGEDYSGPRFAHRYDEKLPNAHGVEEEKRSSLRDLSRCAVHVGGCWSAFVFEDFVPRNTVLPRGESRVASKNNFFLNGGSGEFQDETPAFELGRRTWCFMTSKCRAHTCARACPYEEGSENIDIIGGEYVRASSRGRPQPQSMQYVCKIVQDCRQRCARCARVQAEYW